jgi:hypothetical protein
MICRRQKFEGPIYNGCALYVNCHDAKSTLCTVLTLPAIFMAAILFVLMTQDVANNHQRPDKIIDLTTVSLIRLAGW